MTWQLALQLALAYGPEWVAGVIGIIKDHSEPTAEAWTKVLALSQVSLLEYVNGARAKAGLPPLTSYDPATDPGAPSKP